jgi:hypothetical protein
MSSKKSNINFRLKFRALRCSRREDISRRKVFKRERMNMNEKSHKFNKPCGVKP